MKIIHQLLDFMESYDMAEANAKKICKELIERKFMKQPVIIKPTFADLPATIALFDKRKHRSLIGK